jgi:hypothetical protein
VLSVEAKATADASATKTELVNIETFKRQSEEAAAGKVEAAAKAAASRAAAEAVRQEKVHEANNKAAQFNQDKAAATTMIEVATHKDIFAKENTALKKATAATAVDIAAIKDAAGKSHVGLRTKGGKNLEKALGEQVQPWVQLDLAKNAISVTRNEDENECHKAPATREERTEVLEEAKNTPTDAKRSPTTAKAVIKKGAALKEIVETAVAAKASIDRDEALGAAKKTKKTPCERTLRWSKGLAAQAAVLAPYIAGGSETHTKIGWGWSSGTGGRSSRWSSLIASLGEAKRRPPPPRHVAVLGSVLGSASPPDSCTAVCDPPWVLTAPTTPAVAVLGETAAAASTVSRAIMQPDEAPHDAKQMKWDDRYVIIETKGC